MHCHDCKPYIIKTHVFELSITIFFFETSEPPKTHNDNNNNNAFKGEDNNESLSEEEIQKELSKWVKRSTIGSFIYSAILVSWIVMFQLNRDSFGPGWFIYSPSNEALTGW